MQTSSQEQRALACITWGQKVYKERRSLTYKAGIHIANYADHIFAPQLCTTNWAATLES